MTTSTFNMDGLKGILKALEGKASIGRVGILGSSSRADGKATNALIGAVHEFGTSTVPMRSFLRMPLTERLAKTLQASGAFSESALNDVIKQGSMKPWVEKMSIEAVGVVLDAFDTGGFGRWQALSPATLEQKKVKMVLVETQQLRNSITYDVK